MSLAEKTLVKHTPAIDALLPERSYCCEELGCKMIFNNQSHLHLHQRKRHKILASVRELPDANQIITFHCPVEKCKYHAETLDGSSFKNLRLIRQHYQKMHLVKEFKCKKCNEKFLLAHQLEAHRCMDYVCPVCQLDYGSKAALRTHMRRKNHVLDGESYENEKTLSAVRIPSLTTGRIKQKHCIAAPTVINVPPVAQPTNIYLLPTIIPFCPQSIENPCDTQVKAQIDELEPVQPLPEQALRDANANELTAEEVDRLLRDMETQTDDVDLDAIDISNEELAPLLRDIETQTRPHEEPEPMFGTQTSTHMHTQTCDELFEELGLSHIQTQTNWQDGLYITQYTQTCDEMLDEILENFQSTYTQTRWMDWQDTDDGGA